MPGDKLKRVKSVKKWLDKAENSYLNNKDISGELNLMMAQVGNPTFRHGSRGSPIYWI